MQQLAFWGPSIYFIIGHHQKTSFATQFCRQNNYTYCKDPSLEQVQKTMKNCIIEGSLQLFYSIEKCLPQLSLIYLGQDLSNDQEKNLRMQYLKIGKCIDVPKVDYKLFTKALYPNLIFVFGAVEQQCYLASTTLAQTIGYSYSFLPSSANEIVSNFDKTKNYVINGFFSTANDIQILQNYFDIRVINFRYEAQNLPKHDKYFDFEFDLLPLVANKPYFTSIDGSWDPVDIMDDVTKFLCPNILYVNLLGTDTQQYVDQYLNSTNGLKLSILEIQHIRKRKNLGLATTAYEKLQRLTQILYVDLNRKEVLLTDFPFETTDIIELENINRKITYYIDLVNPLTHRYTKEYSGPIYFLQNQKRMCLTMDQPLSVELNTSQPYWIVSGAGTCGKTTVAKFICSQFGYKYIDYEAECAAAKQKIATPEDGDEVPVKKYIDYFSNMVKNNKDIIYVFDGINYGGNDLEQWVNILGSPTVINLKVQADEQIKRTRKKAEADLAAEVSEEESSKAAELIEKNNNWVQNLCEICPSSKVYQVDYKLPQLLAEPLINSILKPRIFLVQANNNPTYHNIALKYNLGFINLSKNKLKQCKNIVRKCGKRDIILCGYATQQQHLVSEQLYWIEKNLGDIRYVGIWNPQQKQIKQDIMHLERPPVQEKPKKPQGQEGQQKEEQGEQGEDGPPKKKFDIFEHEWTHPKCHKNLSQWYFKLKKNIKQISCNDGKQCFDQFSDVLGLLNSDKEICVYETVK